MRVVEQLGLDEVFEEPTFRARPLEMFEVGVEVHRAQWIAAILVGGQRCEEDSQRVGQTSVGSLALFELQVMDRGVDL